MPARAASGADPLFRFCVIADTHVKPEQGDDSSPWKVNALSAGRSRFVMHRLRELDPELVVNLGDLVHPVPDLPTYGPAAELVRSIYSDLGTRLRVIPGNHDIGDKPGPTLPAKTVQAKWIAQWSSYFGADYQAFVHRDILFVLLNNPLFNSGLPEEAAQRAWLERTLAENAGRRSFAFLHYAPFLLSADEPPNYDNIDEPARAWLLALFERHGVEAVFAGHVHNFFYHRHRGTDHYIAPSTAFVRQDFSELYRAPPLPEHEDGRDDADKLGFFEIAVFARSHSLRFVPTGGRSLREGETPAPQRVLAAHSCREPLARTVGVLLRHPFAEICELPLNGPMDEFARKRARNDYPFLALQRMGLRSLRVPIADIVDPRVRARVADMAAYGHRFVPMCFEPPRDEALDALRAVRDCLEAIEIVVPGARIEDHVAALAKIRTDLALPVVLSRVATSAEGDARASKFLLYVSSGFSPEELAGVPAGIADAVSVRIESEGVTDIAAEVRRVAGLARARGLSASLFLRLAARMPARQRLDDAEIARQVAAFALAVWSDDALEGWVDTLQDIDRGYFVRNGLADRRLNLRLAGRALMHLTAALTRFAPSPDRVALVTGTLPVLPGGAAPTLVDLDSGCLVDSPPALGLAIAR